MIRVVGGDLYQWDTGRKIEIIPDGDYIINEVHFGDSNSYDAKSCKGDLDGRIYCCAIPNILLQSGKGLHAYAVTTTSDGGRYTAEREFLPVKRRPKPENYVYSDNMSNDYVEIAEKLQKLEQSTSSIIETCDTINKEVQEVKEVTQSLYEEQDSICDRIEELEKNPGSCDCNIEDGVPIVDIGGISDIVTPDDDIDEDSGEVDNVVEF